MIVGSVCDALPVRRVRAPTDMSGEFPETDAAPYPENPTTTSLED